MEKVAISRLSTGKWNWLNKLITRDSSRGDGPIKSIYFDTSDWTLKEYSKDHKVWLNEHGDALTLHVVDGLSALLAISDLKDLRNFSRGLASGDGRNGGIICVEVVEMHGVSAVKIIYNYEALPAYAYTGMMIFQFSGVRYVITLATFECGATGVREAFVSAQLAEEGRIEFDWFEEPNSHGAAGKIKGWFYNPYDPDYEGYILNSISDDEKYDSAFPDHPLSRIRKQFRQIQRTLTCAEATPGSSQN